MPNIYDLGKVDDISEDLYERYHKITSDAFKTGHIRCTANIDAGNRMPHPITLKKLEEDIYCRIKNALPTDHVACKVDLGNDHYCMYHVYTRDISCTLHLDSDSKYAGILYVIRTHVKTDTDKSSYGCERWYHHTFLFEFTDEEIEYFDNQKKEADKVNYSYDFKEFGEFTDLVLSYSEICDMYDHTANIVDKCVETIVNNGNNGTSYTVESVYEELWKSFDNSNYYTRVLVSPTGIRTYMDTEITTECGHRIRGIEYGNIYAYKDVMYAANINMIAIKNDEYIEIIIVVYVHSCCKFWSLKIPQYVTE